MRVYAFICGRITALKQVEAGNKSPISMYGICIKLYVGSINLCGRLVGY
jgi:hypothetical protein